MKISLTFNANDAVALWLGNQKNLIEEKIPEENLLVEMQEGAVTKFQLQKCEPEWLELWIEELKRTLPETPNLWRREFINLLQKELKRAQNSKGKFKKKNQD